MSGFRWADLLRFTLGSLIRDRARSIVVAGCGYGAAPGERAKFAEEAEASAKRFEELTMKKAAEGYALGPTRVQHQNKDPRGWREFADQLAEHSTEGAALTMRGVQKRRPSLFDLVDKMKTITVPTLIMTGDEDWPCLEPGILMKKNIPTAVVGRDGKLRPQHQSGRAGVSLTCTCRICFRRPMPAPGRSAIRARWQARSSDAEETFGRHARLFPGHPRLNGLASSKTWMAGTSPAIHAGICSNTSPYVAL